MFTNGKPKLEPASFLLVMVFVLLSAFWQTQTIIPFFFKGNLLTPTPITIVVILWSWSYWEHTRGLLAWSLSTICSPRPSSRFKSTQNFDVCQVWLPSSSSATSFFWICFCSGVAHRRGGWWSMLTLSSLTSIKAYTRQRGSIFQSHYLGVLVG